MKLRALYELAVKKGMKEDQRPKRVVEEVLKDAKKEYRKARGVDKAFFDRERFKNPYADTRILNGKGDEKVKTAMVGVDIGVGEILLADRLREKGVKLDLVISHHPSGKGLAYLNRVMDIQPVLWEKYGLSPEVAKGMMKDRMEEVARNLSAINHTQVMDAARILDIPFMCIHTAADNCVARYLQKKFDQKKPKKLKNVISFLKTIPEYKDAVERGVGPHILIGEEDKDAGKIFVDMTGGTSGPDRLFSRLSQSGVKTIVGMHCKETSFKVAKAEFIHYVIAGHISSDNLGMNLLLDEIERKEKLNFIECSGFKRVSRI